MRCILKRLDEAPFELNESQIRFEAIAGAGCTQPSNA
jgi:hypothetical protein